MTSGTKIALAIITPFVIVLVAYYGFLMPDAPSERSVIEDPVVTDGDGAATAEVEQSTPPAGLEQPETTAATDDPVDPTHGGPDNLAPAHSAPERPPHDLIAARPSLHAAAPESERETPSETLGVPIPLMRGTPRPGDGSDTPGGTLGVLRDTPRDPVLTTPDRPAPTVTPSSPPPAGGTHVVEAGDTMSSIADWWLGDSSWWHRIAKANPLVDPNRMQIGQRLRLPPRDAEVAAEPPAVRTPAARETHVVREGETLSMIAFDYYGDDHLWSVLYEANRRAIGSSPDLLSVGMTLEIPRRRGSDDGS